MFYVAKYIIIWMIVSVSLASSTVISNLNLIFETFNPISMVQFYEFNDKGYNLTDGCIQDMFLYLDGLHRDIFWAVKLFDASGYYSGGIYTGNEFRYGSSGLCRELDSEFHQNYQLNNQPEILNQSIIPFPVRIVTVTYKIAVENSPFAVNNIAQSACLPTSCSYHDLIQVMSYRLQIPNLRNGLFLNNGELAKLRIMNGSYEIFDDSSFYVLAVLTCSILLLTVAAWLSEHVSNVNENNNSNISNSHALYSSPTNTIMTQSAIQQLKKLNNSDHPNCLTELKMDPLAETMTVNNINTNKHVNLVQVRKNKMENSGTISLDIIAGKCDYVKRSERINQCNKSKGSVRKTLLAFSWRKNFNCLINKSQPGCNEIAAICGVQVMCLLWIILIHTCTVLFYVSGVVAISLCMKKFREENNWSCIKY